MKALFFCAVLCFLLFLTSCASIFSGSMDEVSITSEPAGSLVVINDIPYGHTPLSVELEKGETYRVEVSSDGYETGYAVLSNKLGAGWIVLDVFTGLIPLIVDAVTGAWNSLSPDSVYVVLEPVV